MFKLILILISVSAVLVARPTLLPGQISDFEEIPPSAEPVTEGLYDGEVVSVTPETRELKVQYYDYETNVFKEISLQLDDYTQMENVKALGEIIAGDTVNVEYVKEGDKNIVRIIVVEKEENEDFLPSEE